MKNQSVNNELATGKSPEPAGKNACPTSDAGAQPTVRPADDRPQAERYNVADRRKLVGMFEDYGLSVAGFDGLRCDAYEKQVAAVSVSDLEKVYEALLDPALGFAAARERCPVWPEGSRQAGKLPSMMTLREIKERILLEWKVQDRMRHGDFVKRLQEVGLDEEELMRAANMILGEELLSAKLEGTPIMENLRVLDRMLRIAGLQLRQRTQKRQQEQQEWKQAQKDAERKTRVQGSGTGTKAESDQRDAGPKLSNDETKMICKPVIGSNARPKTANGLVLTTGYEPLNWLPSLEKKDSLVDLIMGVGGPS